MKTIPLTVSQTARALRQALLWLSGGLAFAALAAPGRAQVSYTTVGAIYAQNFDSLTTSGAWTDNSTLPGWYTFRVVPNAPVTSYQVDDGSGSTSGIIYSYGTTGQTDRAIGILTGTTPGDCIYGVRITNNTGTTLTSFTPSFRGEQWRLASNLATTVEFSYKIGSSTSLNDNTIPWVRYPSLDFTSPVTTGTVGPLDGNASGHYKGINNIITGISWPPGTDLWLRFYYPAVVAHQGLAIDGFSFSATNDPLAAFYREAIGTVATVDSQLASNPGALEVRNLPLAAYICLALNYPNPTAAVTKAETYLNDMFGKQDTTVGSSTFGHFYWHYTDTGVTDINSTDFCMKPLAVVLKRYGTRLGPTYVTSITAKTENAMTASIAHNCPVNYTNIYTMEMVYWIVIGEALGDSTLKTTGLNALNAWIADLHGEYIHEYNSPTYTPVSYGNLLIGANNISDGVASDKCRALLDLLGADNAVNYFPGQSKMSGSHSRDYDFATGNGAMDHFYYLEGLRAALFDYVPASAGIYFYLNAMESGYRTPPDILAYGDATQWPTRILRSVWGPTTAPGEDRYHYMTPDFSIGSSGNYYTTDAPLDKNVAADLASPAELGQVSVIYDAFDSPYGTVSVGSPGSTETVGAHMKAAVAIVQDHAAILSLANLSPEWNALGPYTNIAADILFPAEAGQIYLNGALISPTGTYSTTLNSVIAVREGNAVIAARFFLVDGLKTYTPTFAVKFDDPAGVSARMVAYLYQGASTTFNSTYQPRIGSVVVAQKCVDDASTTAFLTAVHSATITPVTSGSQWSASVTLNGTTLAAKQDTSNNSILYRTVNGTNYVSPAFTLNNGASTTVDLNKKFLTGMIDSGWVQADIGTLPAPSTASYNASAATTSVTSISGDYWTAADAGSFTYRPITGDCDVSARVDSLSFAHTWSKGGVMVRESLAPGAACALTYITPGQGARFSYRPSTGAAQLRGGTTGITAPYYVRLTRAGDVFTSYIKTDTGSWVQLNTPQTIPMAPTVYVGFAVCSCTTAASTTAVFSHASVTP